MMTRTATDEDLRYVLHRVSSSRQRELTGTHWTDNMDNLADELIAVRQANCARLFALLNAEATPAAIVGVLPFGPGLGGMIWASTRDWPKLAIPSHRWWRQYFVPQVLAKYRRVEFTALREDEKSRRWLEGLGFTEEGIAYRQGKRGDDYVHCAWINPDYTVGVTRCAT